MGKRKAFTVPICENEKALELGAWCLISETFLYLSGAIHLIGRCLLGEVLWYQTGRLERISLKPVSFASSSSLPRTNIHITQMTNQSKFSYWQIIATMVMNIICTVLFCFNMLGLNAADLGIVSSSACWYGMFCSHNSVCSVHLLIIISC